MKFKTIEGGDLILIKKSCRLMNTHFICVLMRRHDLRNLSIYSFLSKYVEKKGLVRFTPSLANRTSFEILEGFILERYFKEINQRLADEKEDKDLCGANQRFLDFFKKACILGYFLFVAICHDNNRKEDP